MEGQHYQHLSLPPLQTEMNPDPQEQGHPLMVPVIPETSVLAVTHFPWEAMAPRVSLSTRNAQLPSEYHHRLPSRRSTILHPGSWLWLPTWPQPLHLSLAQMRGPGCGS